MMKYSTYTEDLVWDLPSGHLPPARQQPHPLTSSTQATNQEETKNPGKKINSQLILYWLCLHTQNPGIKEVDPKTSSTKSNKLRPRKNTTANKDSPNIELDSKVTISSHTVQCVRCAGIIIIMIMIWFVWIISNNMIMKYINTYVRLAWIINSHYL